MNAATTWEGVDKTVEKMATAAGHPPREPYINTDQGDLLLFLFLLAGAVGGFIVGYTFRALFPPRKRVGHDADREQPKNRENELETDQRHPERSEGSPWNLRGDSSLRSE